MHEDLQCTLYCAGLMLQHACKYTVYTTPFNSLSEYDQEMINPYGYQLCASLLWHIAVMLLLSILDLDSYIDYNR